MPYIAMDHDTKFERVVLGCASDAAINAGECGTVFAVFRSACYVKLDSGRIIMFHDSRHGSVLFGIGISNLAEALHSARLYPGVRVILRREGVMFPHLRWQIRSYDTYHAIPKISHDRTEWVNLASRALEQHPGGAVKGLWEERDNMCMSMPASGKHNICCVHAYSPFKELLHACITGNDSRISGVLRTLVGLGPGLTPSMDDCLCGMVYVLTAKRHPSAPGLAQHLRETAAFTTPISSAYLMAACGGGGMEMMDRVLSPRDENDFERLMSIGGNSGADILTGMAFGMWI